MAKKIYNIYLTQEDALKISQQLKSKGLVFSFVSKKVFGERQLKDKYTYELLTRVLNQEKGMSPTEYEKLLQYANGVLLTQAEYEKLQYAKDKLDRIEMMLFAPKC